MGTFSAMFISVILSATDPVSPEELQVAIAAVEEHFSGLRSLEVKYTVTYERVPGVRYRPDTKDMDAQLHHWVWKEGKQYFSITRIDDPEALEREWWFDGLKTSEWWYEPQGERKLKNVWIRLGPPRAALFRSLILASVIGLVTPDQPEGVSAYWRQARARGSLVPRRKSERLEFALGEFEEYGRKFPIFLVVDPGHDYRFAGWRFEGSEDIQYYDQSFPSVYSYVIDEFQPVLDEFSSTPRWFPLRARYAKPVEIIRVVVESVSLNHDVPDTRFVARETPFGTLVNEETVPGKPPPAIPRRRGGGPAAAPSGIGGSLGARAEPVGNRRRHV